MAWTIVAICGQSNASGRAVAPYTNVLNLKRTRLWDNRDRLNYGWDDPHDKDIAANAANIDYDAAAAGSVAPALSNWLTKEYKYVAIVACSKGGSGLYNAAADGTWWGFRNAADHDDDTTLYGNSVKNINNAISDIGGISNVEDIWIVWIQGEKDAVDGVSHINYAAQLTTLVGWYREDVATNVKFAIVNLGYSTLDPANINYHAIRLAQRDVANTVRGVYRTKDARDISYQDSVHYSVKGFLTLGSRLGDCIYYNRSYRPKYLTLDLTNCVCLISGTMMSNARNTPANTNANGYQVPCYQGESALATINPTLQNFGNGEGWISPEFVWNQDFLSNQQINFGNIANLNSTDRYTIELWIKLGDITDVCYLYQKRIDNNNMVSALTAGGEMYIYTATGAAEYGKFTLSGTVNSGKYFHMVVVYDGSLVGNANKLKCYINGRQITLAFTGIIDSTTANLAAANFMLGGHANSLDNNSAIQTFVLYDDADVSVSQNYKYGSDYGGLWLVDQGDGTAIIQVPPKIKRSTLKIGVGIAI